MAQQEGHETYGVHLAPAPIYRVALASAVACVKNRSGASVGATSTSHVTRFGDAVGGTVAVQKLYKSRAGRESRKQPRAKGPVLGASGTRDQYEPWLWVRVWVWGIDRAVCTFVGA